MTRSERPRSVGHAIFALLAGASAVAGCGNASKGASGPPPLAAVEIKRWDESCAAYSDALCTCSAQKPDLVTLAERCRLDKALPESLRLAVEMAGAPGLSAADQQLTQEAARKLGNRCLQGLADLTANGCR